MGAVSWLRFHVVVLAIWLANQCRLLWFLSRGFRLGKACFLSIISGKKGSPFLTPFSFAEVFVASGPVPEASRPFCVIQSAFSAVGICPVRAHLLTACLLFYHCLDQRCLW